MVPGIYTWLIYDVFEPCFPRSLYRSIENTNCHIAKRSKNGQYFHTYECFTFNIQEQTHLTSTFLLCSRIPSWVEVGDKVRIEEPELKPAEIRRSCQPENLRFAEGFYSAVPRMQLLESKGPLILGRSSHRTPEMLCCRWCPRWKVVWHCSSSGRQCKWAREAGSWASMAVEGGYSINLAFSFSVMWSYMRCSSMVIAIWASRPDTQCLTTVLWLWVGGQKSNGLETIALSTRPSVSDRWNRFFSRSSLVFHFVCTTSGGCFSQLTWNTTSTSSLSVSKYRKPG